MNLFTPLVNLKREREGGGIYTIITDFNYRGNKTFVVPVIPNGGRKNPW